MKRFKSEIEITLDDGNGEKQYTLRYDLNALAAFEDLHNKSILEIFSPSLDEFGNVMLDDQGRPVNMQFRMGMIRDLIWVGLIARQPEITREEVGSMIDPAEAEKLFSSDVVRAISSSNSQEFPQENPTRKRNPKK